MVANQNDISGAAVYVNSKPKTNGKAVHEIRRARSDWVPPSKVTDMDSLVHMTDQLPCETPLPWLRYSKLRWFSSPLLTTRMRRLEEKSIGPNSRKLTYPDGQI